MNAFESLNARGTMHLQLSTTALKWLLILVFFFETSASLTSSIDCRDGRDKNADCTAHSSDSGEKKDDTCRLYLARSTIPNAGIGLFTTVPLKEGEQVGYPDMGILTTDIEWHNNGEKQKDFYWGLSNYVWHPIDIAIGADREARDLSVFSPGFGSAGNGHLDLFNVDDAWSTYDMAGLQGRHKDPGAGAFTYYHKRVWNVTKDLGVGSELFLRYGEHWFERREEKFGLVPFEGSYIKADNFLKKYNKLVDLFGENSDEYGAVQSDLWDMIHQSPYKSRSLAALPDSLDVVDRAKKVGMKELRLESSTRSPDWLHQNGKCTDNIRPGTSTILQAGRGAFATRFITEGDIVAPAPLVHIPHRDNLLMYGAKFGFDLGSNDDDGESSRNTSDVIGHQQLLNYCFGHRESTLLLCTYLSGPLYINHDSQSPNARIVWPDASRSLIHNETWLNQTVDYLDEHGLSPGLEFDYVATRDIQPGEEILIDYGNEWEDAWNRHVSKWRPEKGSDEYEDPTHRNCFGNNDCQNVPRIRTEEEQEMFPYGENLEIYCYYNETEDREESDEVTWEAAKDDWRINQVDSEKYMCEILERHHVNGEYLYTVELAMPLEEDEDDPDLKYMGDQDSVDDEDFDFVTLKDVPQYGIQFVNKPYSSDFFLRGSFRHEMMIPYDMMPEAWKNTKH